MTSNSVNGQKIEFEDGNKLNDWQSKLWHLRKRKKKGIQKKEYFGPPLLESEWLRRADQWKKSEGIGKEENTQREMNHISLVMTNDIQLVKEA